MLSITKKADYGLLFLKTLTQTEPETYVPLRHISQTADLPYKFLSQIAIELKAGGLVESKEGLGGGYRLKKSASQISVGEILRLLEGPVAPVGCLRGKHCTRQATCTHRQVMLKLTEVVNRTLGAYTLADLTRGSVAP